MGHVERLKAIDKNLHALDKDATEHFPLSSLRKRVRKLTKEQKEILKNEYELPKKT